MDCFQVGPGLPPKRPYRLMPDHSDTFKVVQRTAHFKAAFSMAVEQAIADIALTRRRSGRTDAARALAWVRVAGQTVTRLISDERRVDTGFS